MITDADINRDALFGQLDEAEDELALLIKEIDTTIFALTKLVIIRQNQEHLVASIKYDLEID